MSDGRVFYQVACSTWDVRLPNPLEHGYETERDFRYAVAKLIDRWRDRIGECVGERNEFLLLRFHDTPGGVPDEEWLPRYILTPCDMPGYLQESDSSDGTGGELTERFGFG